MKKALYALLILAFAVISSAPPTFAATNVALDGVKPAEEEMGGLHNLRDWGPVQPDYSGGGWGGAPWGLQSCRSVYHPSGTPDYGHPYNDETEYATATLNGKGSARTVQITHLDGSADDSFNVYAKRGDGDWIFIGDYTGNMGPEDWVTTSFDLYSAFKAADIGVGLGQPITVKIEKTGPGYPEWAYLYGYGQLGIHEIVLFGNGLENYDGY